MSRAERAEVAGEGHTGEGNGTIGASGATGVGAASIVAAGAGFLISLIVARSLSPADTSQFLIFWGLIFGLFGILAGLQSEATRAVRSGTIAAPVGGGSSRPARVLPAGIGIGVVIAILVLATSPAWVDRLIPAGEPWVVLAIALSAVAYSGHAVLAGASAGRQRWWLYSWLMSVESVVRLLAVVMVALFMSTLVSFELACAVGAIVWLGFVLCSGTARNAILAYADVSLRELLRRYGYSLLSAASTAVLIVGYPVLFSLTSTPAEVAGAAGLLLAVQLTRAPVMVPLQAFQGVAIAAFVNTREHRLRVLARPVAVAAAIGVVGALLAWWLGPWIMLIFGADYVVAGGTLALLTIGAAAMAVLTLSGAAALAQDHHRLYSLGWVVATLVSIALLLIPAAPEVRVAASLCIGPVVGSAVHFLGLARSSRAEARTAEEEAR